MKMGTLIVALVVAGVNIAGIVWLTGGVDIEDPANQPLPQPDAIPISETGPWPKAVVADSDHDFEIMATGEEKSHSFTIKNEGEATLQYKLKGTSCSCTVSDMERDKIYEIPPGEQKEIELTWSPDEPEEVFSKYAEIYTNDPENTVVALSVRGRVERKLAFNPEAGWPLKHVDRKTPQTLTGQIYSSVLDEFSIEKIEVSSEQVKASYKPISDEEREYFGVKCGYVLTVEFDPSDLKTGRIDEKVTVHTNVEEAKEISFPITGNFLGPITAIPWRPEGARAVQYSPANLHLDIGQLSASEGAKGYYKLIIADMPEGQEFEALEIEPTLENVKVTVERQPAPPQAKNRQFAVVTFEVLPGVAPGTYQRKNSVKIQMKTNHPKAEELKFYLEFIAI